MSASKLRLQDFLCFSLYTAEHAFTRAYKPLLDALGLTYPQYLVLVVLWEQEDQTVGQIGEKLFLESSTLTPLLKRLEALGHVSRARDSKDERVVRIRLTEQGRALQARAEAIPGCLATALPFDHAALRALQASLDQLRASLLDHADTLRLPD